MFEPQNKIIVVDNNSEHLLTLGKAFLQSGLGCRTFEYDQSFSPPLKNVRIAFFDINLTEKNVDNNYEDVADFIKNNSPVFNDLAYAIETYISKDNGPFALIFWTQNKVLVDHFITYIQDPDRGYSELPKPSFVSAIDKNEFLEGTDVENLKEKIFEVLDDQTIKLLFDFEVKASKAATEAINQIFEIIPKDNNWGQNEAFRVNFEKTFSKIAASTLGLMQAKAQPDRAVYESLLPILNHQILSLNSSPLWQPYLTTLNSANNYNNLGQLDPIVQRRINSVFHIEQPCTDKDQRGVVIELDKRNPEIVKTFGFKDDNIDQWFNYFITFGNGKDNIKRRIREQSTLIAVEISAACDSSNNKPRINKYILGFKTPIIDVYNDIDKSRRPESSYHIGGADFNFNNEDFQIWLNLNFVFGARSDDFRFGSNLFVLKKEVMDMIGHAYANHISRIGITSF